MPYSKNIAVIAFVDPTQPAQQGQEADVAMFRLAIVGQSATTQNRNWRDAVLALNPTQMMFAYQEQKQRHPTSGTGPGGGPGYDILRGAPVGDTAGINAARDAMCLRNDDGTFRMAGAYYIYDLRIPLTRKRIIDAWGAIFASYVDANGKTKFKGGFLDNWTIWDAESVDPVLVRELEEAQQTLTLELVAAYPGMAWIGNGSKSYRGLNGEMCENRTADWDKELTQHAGQALPRYDIGAIQVAGGWTDAQVEAQMNIALAKGAWFAYSKTYQKIENFAFYQ